MRIGFDAKRIFHNSTGLGNYGRDVIRILHEYTPVEEFVLYNTKPPKVERLNIIQNIFVKYPNNWFWKKLSSVWRLGAVTKQVINDKVDIYHGLSGEMPAGLKKGKVTTVVTIHDLIFLSHPHYYSFFDRIIYKKKFNHAAKNADRIIAISEQTKRDIIKYLKVDAKKIEVIYQGCNEVYKREYDDGLKKEVARKYRLPKQYILNVGTLQERKNALAIVKAAKGTPYTLVLIGSEKKYAKRVHAYIKKNKMQKQVLFLKNVSEQDLSIIYQLATVFCYPSICEGFGIPIIEALFSKVPVIASKGGCFPEAAGPHSLYVSPNDVTEIREKLTDLYEHPEKRKKIAEQGFAYAQKFNDEEVANNIYNLYKKVLK